MAIADFETSLSTAISAGATSLTLSSATDDDGQALPAGAYCFTVNNGSSNKQYLIGQLNGTAVTSVYSVSRQGVETSGAAFAARAGSPVIISDFATIQRVADILRGQLSLDGSNPIVYDAEPTLADRKELATVGYVLDTVSGGTVAFDEQVISGNGGEAIVAGNLVYFKTSDQEWYLTDADAAATAQGVQIGVALGTGSDGVSITGGVQISGTWTTTGLTVGSIYYVSGTAGAITTTPGTYSRVVGLALSTTRLLLLNQPYSGPFAGAGATPTAANKFLTQDDIDDNTLFPPPQVVVFTASGSPHTWSKPAGIKYITVKLVGGGGGGGSSGTTNGVGGAGGGAGGYSEKQIPAASLGTTETVTVGAGGTAGSTSSGGTGGSTSFGTHCSATGGAGGTGNGSGAGGAGGVGSSGDVNIAGQGGVNGLSVSAGSAGAGGTSMLGGGGYGVVSSTVGNAGGNYGGGGSGGSGNSGSTDRAGGAGGQGVCIVTEYYS